MESPTSDYVCGEWRGITGVEARHDYLRDECVYSERVDGGYGFVATDIRQHNVNHIDNGSILQRIRTTHLWDESATTC